MNGTKRTTQHKQDPITRCVSAGRTETGKVRRRNEDAILARDDLGLWVVADGVGGHAAGDYASALIVERLGALRRDGDVYDFIEAIEDTLQQINAELRDFALVRQVDVIASTVVILVHDRQFVLCGWVGDSRAYVYENGQLRQLTRDHVHGLKPDVTQFGAAAHGPAGAGVLTRAIGAEDQLYLDWAVAGSRAGMQFLLCSDGINKELSDDELELAYRDSGAGPHEQLTRLFTQALERAARDNLSAVIVRLDEP
ncbi:PP2C family protein-serine/threonine phosphatase [Paraburkholderia rhizosphaerae]|uniref:Protein phosphatase n=1 Tax=Paraburkholderia rhizosphaerae TaxID=480658 RepID=A0A4V3HFE7_9BURK|nr:PP2C family serine/threonine-protein phosphatase [Paraburkholderia rhizosphaerae]TDY52748.1 protein phosphatase [Paraburkholderia rhizosphaerae]